MDNGWNEYIEQCIHRMNFICRNVPRCPTCDAAQVQIVNSKQPAVWKCRECKHIWGFEPSINQQHGNKT